MVISALPFGREETPMNRPLILKDASPARHKLYVPCSELRAAGDTGSFSGYASIFGNVDLGGDIMQHGAFKEIVTNDDGKVTVLWQHRTGDPIGLAAVKQDERGLSFDGQLVMEDATARKAHAHMKAKSVRGMSIGFDILPGGAEIMESGHRIIKAVKLWEISVVTWGMNPAAQVLDAKGLTAVADIQTERQLEDFLREVGYSARQAKALVSGGFKALAGVRDERGDVRDEHAADDVKALVTFLQGYGDTPDHPEVRDFKTFLNTI
jgi:HK97 family phage prohead protease